MGWGPIRSRKPPGKLHRDGRHGPEEFETRVVVKNRNFVAGGLIHHVLPGAVVVDAGLSFARMVVR